MKIISLWSGPRNVSTALMYSFAQRRDMQVLDEPLYAHYLQISGANHPGRDEVLRSMDINGNTVLNNILSKDRDKNLFIKNMAHHWVSLKDDYLKEFQNIFLIRNPEEMLPSLSKQIEQPILRDTGLKMQVDIFKQLHDWGQKPLIIDSKQLLLDPEGILKLVCKALELPFEDNMLNWSPGPRPEDGIWSKYWYHNVHTSSGFAQYVKKTEPFPDRLKPLLEECAPYYQFLYEQSINT